MLELVQAAGLEKRIQPGAQVEVVGVAEDDLGLDIRLQIPVIDTLDGSDGAHRHENGGADLTVVGRDHTRAGGGLGVLGCQAVFEHLFPFIRQSYGFFCTFV